jgi:hypothetical protein
MIRADAAFDANRKQHRRLNQATTHATTSLLGDTPNITLIWRFCSVLLEVKTPNRKGNCLSRSNVQSRERPDPQLAQTEPTGCGDPLYGSVFVRPLTVQLASRSSTLNELRRRACTLDGLLGQQGTHE